MPIPSNRRTFLKTVLLTICAFPRRVEARQRFGLTVKTNFLRPPGAVSEESFAGKCIRCGRCVEVCPYRCVLPLGLKHGVAAGTPLIDVEQIPCYLCMKCVEICPSGALQKISQEKTRMGLAIVDQHSCVAWQDTTLCRTCYSVCPFPDKAIRLEQFRPVVDERYCTGCGICTHACPVPRQSGGKAINIEPIYAAEFSLPSDDGTVTR
ncbi:MAG: 4Fe-4S dicluster domain-containing protein [Deltaproteobacteria bacterium]|nr:4Fe-4S dicluster domain-containing protein [Deltaproteobacteria bacterium]